MPPCVLATSNICNQQGFSGISVDNHACICKLARSHGLIQFDTLKWTSLDTADTNRNGTFKLCFILPECLISYCAPLDIAGTAMLDRIGDWILLVKKHPCITIKCFNIIDRTHPVFKPYGSWSRLREQGVGRHTLRSNRLPLEHKRDTWAREFLCRHGRNVFVWGRNQLVHFIKL